MKKRALSILLSLSLILCLLPVAALGTMSSRGTGGLLAGRGGTAPRLLAGTEELGPELPGTDGLEQPEIDGPEGPELPGTDGAVQPEAEGPEEPELPGTDGAEQPEAESPEECELSGSDGAGQPEAESPEEPAPPETDGLEQLETLSSYVESNSLEAEQESGRATPEAAYQTKEDVEFSFGTLAEACANVYPGGVVVVMRDIELEKGVTVTKPMMITSNGNAQYKITYTAQDRGDCLLTIKGGVSVTMAYLTLDGGWEEGREAHAELVKLSGSQLILRDEAILQNNNNTDASESAGGLRVLSGGQAQLWPNSRIRNCRGTLGGGVAVVGNNVRPPSSTGSYHLIMLGGVIEDCRAVQGGGVYIEQQGTMFLAQGDSPIRRNRAEKDPNDPDNKTSGCGGGIFLDIGYVQMGSGSIEDNTAENSGGGVFVHIGNFIQGGGIVTGNYAEKYGGGILVAPYINGTTVTLGNSPNVTGNTGGNRYFDNVYLDNDELFPQDITHPITIATHLGPTTSIGVSRWLRPDKDNPYRIVAVPGSSSLTLSDSDLEKFHSDDPNYIVMLRDGNIVLTSTQVIFDNQDHGPTVPGQELDDSHKVIEPDETKMIERGYGFEGWYKEPECENPWDFNGTLVDDNGDRPILTLYAKWSLLHYKIVYELEGGENAENNPGEYTVESDPIFLEEPTREGYRFLGWEPGPVEEDEFEYTTPAGRSARSVRSADPDIPAGSIGKRTFTAIWEELPKYTVTYKDDVDGNVLQENKDVYEGSATPAFVGTPTREGYTFKEWLPAVAPTVTEDVVYIAQWEKIPTYTVTYQDGVGGAAFTQQVSKVYEGSATPAFVGTPQREGYIFKGWSPEVADKVTDDTVYTAQWEEAPKPPDPPGPSGGGNDDDDGDPPKGPDPGPGEEPPQDPGTDPAPEPGTEPAPEPDPGTEPAPGPGEGPAPKPDPMPQTGDPTHTALWAGCALASLAGIVLVLRPQRRRR